MWYSELLRHIIRQNDAILAALALNRPTHLSPEDQVKLNTIFETVAGDSAKIDHAMGSGAIKKERTSMARTIDEALAAVTAANTRVDSIIADRASLKDQLTAALAGTVITPETQAKIDSIFDISTSDAAKVDAALNANVPPPAPGPQSGKLR